MISAYLVGGMSLHQLGGLVPVVVLVGGSIGVPAVTSVSTTVRVYIWCVGNSLPFGEDEDVAVPAERIGEDGCTRFQSANDLLGRSRTSK